MGHCTMPRTIDHRGINTALSTTTIFESVASPQNLLLSEMGTGSISPEQENRVSSSEEINILNDKIRQLESELNQIRLKEVEEQQSKFENQNP